VTKGAYFYMRAANVNDQNSHASSHEFFPFFLHCPTSSVGSGQQCPWASRP
jgi:hypothetical protein